VKAIKKVKGKWLINIHLVVAGKERCKGSIYALVPSINRAL